MPAIALVRSVDWIGGGETISAFDDRLSRLRQLDLELLKEVKAIGTMYYPHFDLPIKLKDEVRTFEIELISAALLHTQGNQTHAASLLGINHTTLNQKIKRYGLTSNGRRGRPNHKTASVSQATRPRRSLFGGLVVRP